ncbi:hypothetical protein D3C78_1980380 [compost metagenome]
MIDNVLAKGNEAMRFIQRVEELGDLRTAMMEAIDEAEAIDHRWARTLAERANAAPAVETHRLV